MKLTNTKSPEFWIWDAAQPVRSVIRRLSNQIGECVSTHMRAIAELDAIEAEAKETDKALREIVEKVGV